MFKIFSGANGLYVAWQGPDGFHRQPSDNGSEIGWNGKRAEKVLAQKIRQYAIDHPRRQKATNGQ